MTSLVWGSGVDSWDAETLYMGVDGHAELVSLPLGLPGRPLAGNGEVNNEPLSNSGIEPIFDCTNLPEQPISVTELDKPRGYHDLMFDNEGYIIGTDGFNLVRVNRDDQVQIFALNYGDVEGMDWLADGSLAVASYSGIDVIAPNGSTSTLTSSLSPYGVTTGPDGLLYVADNTRVYRVDPATGEVEILIDPSDYDTHFSPRNVEFDPDYTLMYMATLGESDIWVVPIDENLSPIGDPQLFATIPGTGYQDGLGVDICGNLYVPDYNTSALYRVTPDGVVSKLFQFNTDLSNYGHGLNWGSGIGGWDAEALYMPQPYDDNTVVEVRIGVPSRKYVPSES
jgi:hypothetical protein